MKTFTDLRPGERVEFYPSHYSAWTRFGTVQYLADYGRWVAVKDDRDGSTICVPARSVSR